MNDDHNEGSEISEPLTPDTADLRDFPFTPMFRSRLFGSSFHAHSTDGEWRAGVTLWMKSWDQVPAGSLPTDDVELCRLAELGRDLKTWRKVKEGALRGWQRCAGRLYHKVVAEGVNAALAQKAAQRVRTAKARIAALEKHLALAVTDDDKSRITDEIRNLRQSLLQTPKPSVTDVVTESKGSKEREREKLKASEANASGGAPPDAKERVYAFGVPLLTAAGVSDRNARSMLGGLCKANTDEAVAEAIDRCAIEKPIEPVAWLQAALSKGRARKQDLSRVNYSEGVNEHGTV